MNIKGLLAEGIHQMVLSDKEEHVVDVEWLLCEITGLSRTVLALEGEKELPETMVSSFRHMLTERLNGRPLQHILGYQSFYGYDFEVNASVLIPRFETEELVDKAIKWATANEAKSLIDMCTGSGCIGLTVLMECPWMSGILVDLSKEALEVAVRNTDALNVADRVQIIASDLFANVDDQRVDMILSNPPYIVTEVIEGLDEEVKRGDPYMALDGGADGLDFYRKIAKEAKNYLNTDGILLFEIGYDQMDAVSNILLEESYVNIEGFKDLFGKDRMVLGMR